MLNLLNSSMLRLGLITLNPMTVGQRIREARKAANLTQESLGAAVGVTDSAVAQWESDKTTIRGPHLVAVSTAVGRSCHWLVTGKDEADQPTPAMSDVAAELVDWMSGVPDPVQQQVLESAQKIIGRHIAEIQAKITSPKGTTHGQPASPSSSPSPPTRKLSRKRRSVRGDPS